MKPTKQRRPRTVSPLFWFRCARCNYLTYGTTITRECDWCVQAAKQVWPGAHPIRGEASGS